MAPPLQKRLGFSLAHVLPDPLPDFAHPLKSREIIRRYSINRSSLAYAMWQFSEESIPKGIIIPHVSSILAGVGGGKYVTECSSRVPYCYSLRFLKAWDGNVPKAHKMVNRCRIEEFFWLSEGWKIKLKLKIGCSMDVQNLVASCDHSSSTECLPSKVNCYVQSHIQMNEYRDHGVLVSFMAAALFVQ